ncbi:MAG: signal peptidase I [Candidatus Vogelbacteria bacterium CG10_big_fil_rev_8_21_14_0_10_50_13]|uniref:Signal peptidase I n=1 Tax=Candidatus Vogelbacteria bacterium CG10_big_fil_rev_8_21_14_0_10_50_13 TaxID=1975044 RepID=A0A2H0RHY0_9BACT|nr:MAG: signal peptidase I [Candidatus Vogelbacteria bacterium CG10_big_fil_rev_8_21_14_0_10_50_13]
MTDQTRESIWEALKFGLITIAIVIPVRAYVAQPFIVSGSSMVPTFEHGEYLVIDELSYHFREAKRGEVIVFRYPKDPSKFFIKRVIGLPGERLELSTEGVTILATDGQVLTLEEDYIKRQSLPTQTVKLDAGEYFVMGDNRLESLDSRSWGPVTDNLLKGRVLLRLLPISKAELLPGQN